MFKIRREKEYAIFGAVFNDIGYEGLIEHVLVDLILPKYEKVICDGLLTKSGLAFVKRMFKNSKLNVKIFDKHNNKTVETPTIEMFMQYHKPNSGYDNYRTMVSLR